MHYFGIEGLKVGDKVRCTADSSDSQFYKVGEVYTVEQYRDTNVLTVRTPSGERNGYYGKWELVKDIVVGSRVKINAKGHARWGRNYRNPANTLGTVVSIKETKASWELPIKVQWDNFGINGYCPEDLDLVTEEPETEAVEMKETKVDHFVTEKTETKTIKTIVERKDVHLTESHATMSVLNPSTGSVGIVVGAKAFNHYCNRFTKVGLAELISQLQSIHGAMEEKYLPTY